MKSKKGFSIMEVPKLGMVLVVIAIVLSVGSLIVTQVRDRSDTTTTLSQYDTNSTFTALDSTSVNFASTDHSDATTCDTTNTVVRNSTNLADITSDFTLSGCTATLTETEYNNTRVTINYTYYYTGYLYAYNFTNEGNKAVDTLSDWQVTFSTIIAAAVVLGIIGAYLMYKRN